MNYKNHEYDNTVIEVLTYEHGKEVIKFWKDQCVYTGYSAVTCCKSNNNYNRFYGLIDGKFKNYTLQDCIDNLTFIMKLPTIKEHKEVKPYPKMMLVSKFNGKKTVEFVLCCIDGVFLSLSNIAHEELFKELFVSGVYIDSKRFINLWTHAEEIEEIELTIEEIAKKFGVDVKQIKIKK